MRAVVKSWLIRGLILTGVAVLVALGWVANSWVSPERVREQVIATLTEQLDGVDVHVGSARMRILGGIAVRDLKLTRRGSATDQPFFSAPAAVVYHDKEQMNRGRVVIRKIELENPELHLERTADGRWNLADALRPGPADRPVPMFVAKGGTLTIADHAPDGLPPLRLTDARFSLTNDPLPVLDVNADANAQGYGPVQFRARLNRVSRAATIKVELPAFPLGEVAAVAAARFAPDLAPHLTKFAATAAVAADLNYAPDSAPAWHHDVRVDVKDGRLEHPDLPWPVERIAVKFRSVDGRVKVDEATAKVGPARVRVALETRSPESGGRSQESKSGERDAFARVEEHVQKLDLTVSGVPLDDALFARLGDDGAKVKRMFAPTGSTVLAYRFAREAAGWRREFEARPQGVGATFHKFKYPVADLRGTVKRTVTHAGGPNTVIDLRGTAAGQPVTLTGQAYGEGEDPAIDLRLAGTNLPLDDALVAALPGRFPNLIRQFRASGRADVRAKIVQRLGVNLCENEFEVDIHDAAVNFTQFPYPFEKVKGRVIVRVSASDPARPVRPNEPIRPTDDKDEFVLTDFTAVHAGATVRMYGRKRAVPGSRDRRLELHLDGTGCPIDAELQSAVAGLDMGGIWASFAPRGKLTFAADVDILDRAAPINRPDADPPFNPASDLKLTFNFYGPTVTPAFFPYDVADLSGWLQYQDGLVNLAHFAGRHGESRLKLEAGEVRFYPNGSVWANLGGLHGGLEIKPLVADAEFLKALPPSLRSPVEDLKLRGGAELSVKQLVVLTPPDPPAGPGQPPPDPLPIGPAAARPPFPAPLPAPPSLFGQGEGDGRLDSSHITARGQAPTTPVAAPAPTPPPARQPDPIVFWDAQLRLTGASIDTGIAWDELYGAVATKGRYEGTHLGLVVGNLWLDRAVVARQPVTATSGHVRADPQEPDPTRPGQFLPTELKFTNLAGTLFHGAAGGEARVVLTDTPRYEVWLNAAGVRLEEVARHYNLGSEADLKGDAQAKLHLYNRPDPKTGLWAVEGSGTVDVPSGRMYNLPVLLDLVKVFKFSKPDNTAFEEAHATFRVSGDRVKVDQLDLIGKAVCVGGWGEVDTRGEYVRFDFYTLGSEILARLVNTPLGDASALVSRSLFKIRMTRENGVLRYKPEPVPLLTEPVRALTDRLRGRVAKPLGK